MELDLELTNSAGFDAVEQHSQLTYRILPPGQLLELVISSCKVVNYSYLGLKDMAHKLECIIITITNNKVAHLTSWQRSF